MLTERGLATALEDLAARAPVPVTLEGGLDRRPPLAVESALYFTVAEALTNVAKYAGASAVTVTLAERDGRAHVEIADDGRGGARLGGGRACAASSIASARSAGGCRSTAQRAAARPSGRRCP